MRYYSIAISGAPSTFPARYDDGAIWGSHKNGVADPGAQQVEIHIDETAFNVATPDSVITVHGVSWDQIRTTNQLIGKAIVVKGGMMPGLPLATVQSVKRGLLLSGRVGRAWGNWIGTDMSIGISFAVGENNEDTGGGSPSGGSPSGGDGAPSAGGDGAPSASESSTSVVGVRKRLISRGVGFRSLDQRPYARGASVPLEGGPPTVTPTDIGDIGQFGPGAIGEATSSIGGMISSFFGGGESQLQAPLNLIHNMMPNMSLSGAIAETLGKAFPQGGANIGISDNIKLGYQDAGMYGNMNQYANYVQKLSQSVLGIKNYLGVNMTSKGQGINVWDGTKALGFGAIDFFDLIGQPTWINVNIVQVKCIMRGDIQCGWSVSIPATIFAISPGAIVTLGPSGSVQRDNVSIPGSGFVTRVLHIGDFRNPDGVGWSTTYDIVVSGTGMGGETGQGIAGGVPGRPGTQSGEAVLPPSQQPQSRLMSRRGVQQSTPGILRVRRGRLVS
jgi:hypothetical protein